MNKVFEFVWQLPQNLLGLCIKTLCAKQDVFAINNHVVTTWGHKTGLSLGKYIFIPKDCTGKMFSHEYGHSIQSLYLGCLYLPIIGLPSICWAALYKVIGKRIGLNYYNFYTEKWADKLTGIKRGD